jgi:hypothetical protein
VCDAIMLSESAGMMACHSVLWVRRAHGEVTMLRAAG